MCGGYSTHAEVDASAPRPAPETAVDPIAPDPVGGVVITTLVDNSYGTPVSVAARGGS